MTQALFELAERVEAATGDETRLLLIEAAEATLLAQGHDPDTEEAMGWLDRFEALIDAGAFLDAAMMLVPEGWRFAGSETVRGDFYAHLITREMDNEGAKAHAEATARTFPLALVSAALRARAAQGDEQ